MAPMLLWTHWCAAIALLRPAFSRRATFWWFAACAAGLSVRSDNLGVTSVVRALGLDPERGYASLLRNIHSSGIDLDILSRTWTHTVWRLFAGRLERIEGRPVLVADGKNIARSGNKMPGVKSLHQHSESNTKPAFIMGHCAQAISVLARAGTSTLAVPLGVQIHDGTVFSNRDKRTLLDKLLTMLAGLGLAEPVYLVADAYYGNGKVIKGLLDDGHHLVSRARSNAVAYHRAPTVRGKRSRGRPRLYGKKVKLARLFDSATKVETIPSPVYAERNVTIRVRTVDLLWKPAARVVRFVLVEHPVRGRIVLMCSDTALAPVEIIRAYGLRFKIEFGFKQAAHVVGSYGYHFWMADWKPTKRGGGNRHLHHESGAYREAVRRKLHAYHVFLAAGVVTQGLMHYLSACHTETVWASHRSWLRTIRRGTAPSELVVKLALRRTLPEYLLASGERNDLAKFIVERQRPETHEDWALAA